jgi:hypothetical protein
MRVVSAISRTVKEAQLTHSVRCCSAKPQSFSHVSLRCPRNCAKKSMPSLGIQPFGSMLKWSIDVRPDSWLVSHVELVVQVILQCPQSGTWKCLPSLWPCPAGNQIPTEKVMSPLVVGSEMNVCSLSGCMGFIKWGSWPSRDSEFLASILVRVHQSLTNAL